MAANSTDCLAKDALVLKLLSNFLCNISMCADSGATDSIETRFYAETVFLQTGKMS